MEAMMLRMILAPILLFLTLLMALPVRITEAQRPAPVVLISDRKSVV